MVNEGDAASTLSKSQQSLSRDYENPFSAHATLEPMNCTASVTAERCEIWAPTQGQELAHAALKGILRLRDDQIVVHRSSAIGGGFGRRLIPDFVIQAALVSKAVRRPVKLIWDREEDFLHDFYRPATLTRLSAAVGPDGLPSALAARVVSPTILLPVFPTIAPMLQEKRIDPSALEGMLEMHYKLPSRRVDFHLLEIAVPTSVMRTTGYGPNLFALESFIDELAHAAKIDPYRYRRRLLTGDTRALAVLDRAAKMGRWGTPLPKGAWPAGIAFVEAFGTLLAQVAEVEVGGSEVKLLRVSSAVDCGEVLDPASPRRGSRGASSSVSRIARTRSRFATAAPSRPISMLTSSRPWRKLRGCRPNSSTAARSWAASARRARWHCLPRSPTPSSPQAESDFARCRFRAMGCNSHDHDRSERRSPPRGRR